MITHRIVAIRSLFRSGYTVFRIGSAGVYPTGSSITGCFKIVHLLCRLSAGPRSSSCTFVRHVHSLSSLLTSDYAASSTSYPLYLLSSSISCLVHPSPFPPSVSLLFHRPVASATAALRCSSRLNVQLFLLENSLAFPCGLRLCLSLHYFLPLTLPHSLTHLLLLTLFYYPFSRHTHSRCICY